MSLPAYVRDGLGRGHSRLSAAVRPRRMLRAVPRLRSRRPRVPFVMLVSLVLVTGVVGLLLFNTSMQQASFDSTRLEEQAAALSAREEGLQMELERLRDPQRLAALARRNGMVPARSAAFLDLETGEVSGPKPTPAKPGDGLPVAAPQRPKPKVLTPPPVQVPAEQTGQIGEAAVQGPVAPGAGATGAPRGNRGAGAHSGGTGR